MSLLRPLLFAVVLCILFSSCSPHFLTLSNLDNILSAGAVVGLLALGSTFVIASGEIDLSVASVMALCGTLCAAVIQESELSPIFAVSLSVGIGGLVGFLTGALINLTRAPSFIVSLGMLSVARAIAYIASDGTPIYDLPERVTILAQGRFAGISGAALIFLFVAVLSFVVLHATAFGSRLLFLGDSTPAGEAMGLDRQTIRLKVFSVSGLFAGLAGFLFMARTNAGDPTAGQNYELAAITAVVLGGARLFGGRANILGTVLGVLCLGILQNGLNLLAVSTYYQVLFVGLVLISAAFLERFERD